MNENYDTSLYTLQNVYLLKFCESLKRAVKVSKKFTITNRYKNSENKTQTMWQIIQDETNNKPLVYTKI